VKKVHPTTKAVVKKVHGHVVKVHSTSKAVIVKGNFVNTHPTVVIKTNPTVAKSSPRRGRQDTLPRSPQIVKQTVSVTEMKQTVPIDKFVMTKMILDSINGNQKSLDDQNRLINTNRVDLKPEVAQPAVRSQTSFQRPVVLQPSTNKPMFTGGQTSKAVVTSPQTSMVNTQPPQIHQPIVTDNHHSHHHNHHNHHDDHDHDHDDDDDDDDDEEYKWRERKLQESKLRFLLWKRAFFNRLRLSKMNRKHIYQRYIRH
jgi:hypothetical protein